MLICAMLMIFFPTESTHRWQDEEAELGCFIGQAPHYADANSPLDYAMTRLLNGRLHLGVRMTSQHVQDTGVGDLVCDEIAETMNLIPEIKPHKVACDKSGTHLVLAPARIHFVACDPIKRGSYHLHWIGYIRIYISACD